MQTDRLARHLLPAVIWLLPAVLGAPGRPLQAQSCPPQNRFDQCIFLTTHNAHSNWDDGWVVHAQQVQSVSDQLAGGFRG